MSTAFTYLKQLIELVEREGDEHNKRKLWSLISRYAQEQVGELPEKETGRLLAEVHELNMEQYIKVQAERFYESFPFASIKSVLINDYIEMEHCRRRDDFERFAMAAYQQLENIVNHLYLQRKLFAEAKIDKEVKMYTATSKDKPAYRYGITLGEQLVFAKKEDRAAAVAKLFAEDKLNYTQRFKVVLYYCYFNKAVISYDQWNDIYQAGYDLYLCRNRNHRGGTDSETQSDRNQYLTQHKYQYYFIFMGFLADIVQTISQVHHKLKKPVAATL